MQGQVLPHVAALLLPFDREVEDSEPGRLLFHRQLGLAT